MNDYIGYKSYRGASKNMILVGYVVYIGEYSPSYSVNGLKYALTQDEKYLPELYLGSIRYAIFSNMNGACTEEIYIEGQRDTGDNLKMFQNIADLRPQKKYTKEDISLYLTKIRLMGNPIDVFNYDTFKDYLKDFMKSRKYTEYINTKIGEVISAWEGTNKGVKIEKVGKKYRYVCLDTKGKLYDEPASDKREELLRYLEVI